MKNKFQILKISGFTALAATVFLAPAKYLFDFVVVRKEKSDRDGKKRFELSHMKKNHPRNGYEDVYEAGKAWCREQEMTDVFLRSRDGLILHAYYFPAEEPKRSVLLSHGYRGSGFGDFANMAKFLHEQGCNLLFIDQRCCGRSEGKYITFGALEQEDVVKWAYYFAGLNGGKLPVYLYGESLGAASVLMASAHKLPPQVRGLISDSAFCSMKTQMKDMALNWFHLSWIGFLLLRLDLLCRTVGGFRMADADTAAALQKNHIPVLFFHGLDDTFVDPKNTLYHYSQCKAPKELVLVPGARHLCCAYVEPELYRRKVMEFFEKYDA